MSKLANKINKRIMAALLSIAMIMSNMTVYASEVVAPEPQAEEVVVEDNGTDEEQSLTEDVTDVESDEADAETESEDESDEADAEESEAAQEETTQPETVEENSSEEGGDNAVEAPEADAPSYAAVEAFAEMDLTNKATALADLEAKGITVDNITYHGSHGIVTGQGTSTMTMTLSGTANVTVQTCIYNDAEKAGKTSDITSNSGKVVKQMVKYGSEGASPKYTVVGATGDLTITFPEKGTYIHTIAVEYSENDYAVLFEASEHGTVFASPAYGKQGTKITLTPEPDNGYKVATLEIVEPTGLTIAEDNTFTMPASDVKVRATFEEDESAVTPTEWNFRSGSDIMGSKGIQVQGSTETWKGLYIDATTGKFDTTRDDWAQVNTGTIIKVPVIGLSNVTINAYKDLKYNVDGDYSVADTTEGQENTFECKGTDGWVTITIESDSYLGGIKVESLVEGGWIDFVAKWAEVKPKQGDPVTGIPGLTTDENITYHDASHGLYTNKNADSKMTLRLQDGKTADISVLSCRYSAGAAMSYSVNGGADKVVEPFMADEGGAAAPRFDIVDAEGTVVLTFPEGVETYIHSIYVEYAGGDDEITFKFDPAAEGIASDGVNTPAGSKFVNGYFEIVTGDAPGKNGTTIELANDAGSGIQFTTKGTSNVAIDACSTSGSNTSNMVLYKVTSGTGEDDAPTTINTIVDYNGDGKITDADILVIDKNVHNVVKYKNLEPGTYKVAVPSKEDEHEYGRGVRIFSVAVTEKVKPVEVTVNVTMDKPEENTELEELVFTCRETKAAVTGSVEENKCVVTLNADYTYDISALPTKYVVAEGSELVMGEATEELKKTHNVTIRRELLRKLTGEIKGLDTKALEALENIIFVKPAEMIYIPEVTINKDGDTPSYEVYLQPETKYTIETEGINDYEVVSPEFVNIATGDDGSTVEESQDITYQMKPTYKITINGMDQTGKANQELTTALASATFTFTNLKEKGYVYTFEGTDDIKLRDGTYSVKVTNSGDWVQKLTSDLVVEGDVVTKEIPFTDDMRLWIFSEGEGFTKESCTEGYFNGLKLTSVSNETGKAHAVLNAGSKIEIPVKGACRIDVTFYHTADATIGTGPGSVHLAPTTSAGTTNTTDTVSYSYTGSKGYVKLEAAGKTYLTKIEVRIPITYASEITVNPDAAETGNNYQTINAALEAVRNMDRTDEDGKIKPVTIKIQPGDYEEMLVIDVDNIKLVNASANPSIKLKDKGVKIDDNAVRITSYYGHGYSYYSMDSNCKWNAEVLKVSQENEKPTFVNPGSGTTSGSYWNATVSINASNITAEGIIFENSFNQYVSKKAAEDTIVKQGSAKEGTTPRADMEEGDVTVQNKEYVERAAALAIYNNCEKISFDNCKFIGRQDTLYGGTGVTAAFYDCSVYGGTDYIFGGMTAVFAKCDLVFNTNDKTEKGQKDDVGYITAAQQSSGRGYLLYNCHVTSTTPGVDTDSDKTSKPGYLGRPWAAGTGEAVFYMTVVDAADASWKTSGIKDEVKSDSLIAPVGWLSSLGGESALSQEYGTYEMPNGQDNSAKRASWSTVLEGEKLKDGKPITVETFLGTWDAFAGKNMKLTDYGQNIPVTTPAIEVTPEAGAGDAITTTSTIALTTPDYTAKIYYNINSATDPTTTESTLYTEPFRVTEDMLTEDGKLTVKAIATRYGNESTVLTSAEYTVSIEYLVEFETDGGSTVDSQIVKKGEKVSKPTDPTKEGNTFIGWYTDRECTAGNEYDFENNTVTEDTTLYAKWEKAKYSVTFNTGEGGSEVTAQTVEHGDPCPAPNAPTKSGYVFDGWYTDSNCTAGNEYSFATPVTGNLELFAKWLVARTVTFETNGGSSISAQIVGDGKTAERPEDPTKRGYTFDNWYSDSECTELYNFTTPVTKDITLYANWTKNSGPETGDGSGLVMTLVDGNSYTYTGSAIIPEVEVKNNGILLTEGIDYTVKCSNNVKVTTKNPAKVTVTGKGNLSGNTSATFS
ncbi:MAG: InlB B-repeat-containing protein, partial [Lachnospiraceae bacterium]|nr:InlB B-repeat-containing protein [Lachnospiraceae bacterium]